MWILILQISAMLGVSCLLDCALRIRKPFDGVCGLSLLSLNDERMIPGKFVWRSEIARINKALQHKIVFNQMKRDVTESKWYHAYKDQGLLSSTSLRSASNSQPP